MSRELGVPLGDRGLAYGDGVFETLPARDGVIYGLEQHLARLARGCAVLGFQPPCERVTRDALIGAARGAGACVIKLIVTRGSGGRGYRPPEHPAPRLYVMRHPWPENVELWRQEGITVVRLSTRLSDQPALAGLKHLNRLDQVLAAADLASRGPAQEGIMFDQHGRPVCGVMTNLFLVRGGTLTTPCLQRCGIAGIIRGRILDLADSGAVAAATVRDVQPEELDWVDEVFLTNSVRGVIPVKRLDGRDLGDPGPLTRAVQRAVSDAGLVV